jgi:hypothetical protein
MTGVVACGLTAVAAFLKVQGVVKLAVCLRAVAA